MVFFIIVGIIVAIIIIGFISLNHSINKNLKKGRLLLSKVADNDKDAILKLLNNGYDVNFCDEDWDVKAPFGKYMTPLELATKKNNKDLISLLLEKGANINFEGKDGRRALYYAVEQKNGELISFLIEKGADEKYRWSFELLNSVKSNDKENVLRLIEKGATVNYKEPDGRTALYYAGIEMNNKEMVQILIDKASNLKGRYNSYSNERLSEQLFEAVKDLDYNAIVYLVTIGANLNFSDKNNDTPLKLVCGFNANKSLALYLIANGADINYTGAKNIDYYGFSPLGIAIFCGNEEIVSLLVKLHADVNRAYGFKTAITVAYDSNKLNIVKLLNELGVR